jgi:uncharacterized protein DUF3846
MPKNFYEDDALLDLARKVVEEAEADAEKNPTSDEILIVVVEPNKKPYKKLMKNDLDDMKEIVGGWIEIVNLGRSNTGAMIAITLNEEGKLIGLPVNRHIVGFDILVGTFFITAYNLQGDNISLTDREADHFINRFKTLDVYL